MFMFTKTFNQKKRKFTPMAYSYIIIIVISILFNTIGYYTSVRSVKNELMFNTELIFDNVENTFDFYLESAKNSAYSIAQSISVTNLYLKNNLTPAERTEHVRNICKNLSNHLAGNRLIKNGMIILKDKDLCISSAFGMCNMQFAYELYFKEYYSSEDEWFNDFRTNSTKEFIFLKSQNKPSRYFAIYNLLEGVTLSNTIIVLEFDSAYATKLLNSLAKDDSRSQINVLNEHNEVIFSSQHAQAQHDTGQDIIAAKNSSLDEDYVTFTAQSSIADLTFMYMVPHTHFAKSLKKVHYSFTLGYLLCLVFGIILTNFFSKTHEKNKIKMENRIKEQNEILKSEFLNQILLRKTQPLSQTVIYLPDNKFILVTFDFRSINHEAIDILKMHITEHFSTPDKIIPKLFFCEIDNMLVSLFAFPNTFSQTEWLVSELQALNKLMEKNYEFEYMCAASDLCDNMENLPDLFEQTIDLITEGYLKEKNSVIFQDKSMLYPRTYEYSIEIENKLINAILTGDYNNSISIVDSVINYNVEELKLNLRSVKLLIIDVTSSILKVATQIGKIEDFNPQNLYMLIFNLSSIKKINIIHDKFEEIINKLCSFITKQIEDSSDSRYQNIIDYIENNFSNPNINVNMIADRFEMSPSYMSRYFADKAGIGMIKYIIRLRLSKSKQLLKTTPTKISKIATEVGFNSTTVFIRTFKKYEGVTPSQYREVNLNEGVLPVFCNSQDDNIVT